MTKRSGRSQMAARRRSAARLAAVQALYQMEITGATPDQVVRNFLSHDVGGQNSVDGDDDAETLVEPDPDMLTQIVFGTALRQADMDGLIGPNLSGDWSVERLEALLRAVLRVGAWELTHRDDIPPKVTISEYVDVAHAFYAGPEPGLVNAVLDKIARKERAEEMSGKAKEAKAADPQQEPDAES